MFKHYSNQPQQSLQQSATLNLSPVIVTQIDDQHVNSILLHYVASETEDPLVQSLQILIRQDKIIATIASSVGHAILSNTRKSPQQLSIAREKYASALKLTSEAIQSQKPARLTNILITILLLAMFEVNRVNTFS